MQSVQKKDPSLGIITGTASPVDYKGIFKEKTFSESDFNKDHQDPIFPVFSDEELKTEVRKARAEKWILKSYANQILKLLAHPDSNKLPRTCSCSKYRVPNCRAQVLLQKDLNKAHLTGLQRCGSVWRCPLCASKVSERRRAELTGAVEVAKGLGLRPLLLTLTFPHGLGDSLTDILDKSHKAMRLFKSGKSAQNWSKEICLEGQIRALEVTYGLNGWHPHWHLLLFVKSDLTVEEIQEGALNLWQKACKGARLPIPSDQHGATLSDGSYAAKYASKWGLENEMTKAHLKHSKGDKGKSPWDLLREAGNGIAKAKYLWLAYAVAFHGRRQLVWSHGLKELLGVQDITDEEIAEKVEEKAELLEILEDQQWTAIAFYNVQKDLLDIAETYPDSLWDFAEYILEKYENRPIT